jgi:hypothetical protein
MYVCVCVCVKESGRQIEREGVGVQDRRRVPNQSNRSIRLYFFKKNNFLVSVITESHIILNALFFSISAINIVSLCQYFKFKRLYGLQL